LKKSKKDNKTLFIDASAQFVRGSAKNTLSEDNRKKILNAYIAREDVEHFAKLVDNSTIGENEYNIAVSSYVEQKDKREVIDIVELNKKIAGIVERQSVLRGEIDKIVAEIEGEI
jgi:type I restriction enzyme M protein